MEQSLEKVFQNISTMVSLVEDMLGKAVKGLCESDDDLLNEALQMEREIDRIDKLATNTLIQIPAELRDQKDNERIKKLINTVGNVERMGDFCEDFIERIKIKLDEEVTFSADAQAEIQDLYVKMDELLKKLSRTCRKRDCSGAEQIGIGGEEAIKLFDTCANEHEDRLIRGLCAPDASSLYLDMLDSMKGITKNIMKIARNISDFENVMI